MKDILIGMAVGDALGVPVEFQERSTLDADPVTDMREYGVHNQPMGTWSDDTSMALCMAESLLKGWDMEDMGRRFLNWFRMGYKTPHGVVFDMGMATQQAICLFEQGKLPATMCGGTEVYHNGNGSLMRILPIVPWFIQNNIDSPVIRYKMVSDLSSITHGHQISVLSCYLLTEFARELYLNKGEKDKELVQIKALHKVKTNITLLRNDLPFNQTLLDDIFHKFFFDMRELTPKDVSGDGFCRNTLISSIFCLLNTTNYKDAVLKAVNLGLDTDTTACVTGGLAGILYGYDSIPKEWCDVLVKHDEIVELANKFKYGN